MFKNWKRYHYRVKHGINKIKGINLINTNEVCPADQIEILERVINYLENKNNKHRFGLCYLIWDVNSKRLARIDSTQHANLASSVIPIFNNENAINYGDANMLQGLYWWDADHRDFDTVRRIKFCKWMIKVIDIESKNIK